MTLCAVPIRSLCLGLASLALVQPARAAGDTRRVRCDQPCALVMKAAVGVLEVKAFPTSPALGSLYRDGDRFQLEGGRDYFLVFNESQDGLFSFDLQFIVNGGGSAWSCRVKAIPETPFIAVAQGAWTGPAGEVSVSTDRARPLLRIRR